MAQGKPKTEQQGHKSLWSKIKDDMQKAKSKLHKNKDKDNK
jgi:hypothetical protein